MLTIIEKAKSETGLRNRLNMLWCLMMIKLQNLVPGKVEYQEGGNKTDDAAYAYIPHEVLREVDARVGTQRSKYQQHQQYRIEEEPVLVPVVWSASLILICQKKRAAAAEHEECRGMAGGEGIGVMHINARYQW